jgi:hypothetical protein
MLTIRVPIKGSYAFNVFVNGDIVRKTRARDKGTDITVTGAAVLFYTYSRCRRAYIIREWNELSCYPKTALPNVTEPVRVIFRARGRQIDLLRKAVYFLVKTRGRAVFGYDALFWQKTACLVEQCKGRYSRTLELNIQKLLAQYLLDKRQQ